MRTNFTKGIWALVMSMAMFACNDPKGTEGDGKDAKLEVNPTEVSFQFDGKTSEGADNVVVDVVSSSSIVVTVAEDAKEWLTANKLSNTKVRVKVKENNAASLREGSFEITNEEALKQSVKVVQTGFEASLTLDADYEANPIVVEAAGESLSLNVYTNVEFDAAFEGEVDWATVEVSGDKVVVEVEESNIFEERTATVVIAPVGEGFEGLAKKVVVKQSAQVHAITATCFGLADGAVVVPAENAELEFAVEANDLWSVSAGDAEWVSVEPAEGSISTTSTSVVFADNAEAEERVATLTFTCGDATQEIKVTQRGSGCFVEIAEENLAVVAASESATFEIPFSTNATSVTVVAEQSWVSGSADIEAGVISLTVAENTEAARETVVTVTGSIDGYEDAVVKIAVKQGQYAMNLAVNAEGEDETANCYTIFKAGSYKFPATVKGNGAYFLDGEGFEDTSLTPPTGIQIKEENIASASLLWSTKNEVDPVTNESTGLLTNVSYSAGYVYFDMAEFEVGNASIAIKDIDGKILWSWHIWATPFDVNAEENTYPVGMTSDGEDAEHVTGYAKPSIFMGLNLGATHDGNHGDATEDEINQSLGMMYEWGRKDPFVGGKVGGGNQVIYYHDMEIDIPEELAVIESTESGFYVLTPQFEAIEDNIQWAVEHPTIYLESIDTYGDNCWMSNLPTPYTEPDPNCNSSAYWGHMWGNASSANGSEGSKSIYDPCPPGWQLPCADHYHIITSHGDNISPYYGCYAPWKYNVKETVDLINEYGFPSDQAFDPFAKKEGEGGKYSWDSDNAIKFTTNWKYGFNVFVGTSNRTNGASGDLVADETVDGAQDRNIEYLSESGTVPMFMPAAGWRMGYNAASMNQAGQVCRYHLNQPANINPEGATWTKYMGKAMSMWTKGNFYRDSAVSWAEWHGNGQVARCIKPVVLEEVE